MSKYRLCAMNLAETRVYMEEDNGVEFYEFEKCQVRSGTTDVSE